MYIGDDSGASRSQIWDQENSSRSRSETEQAFLALGRRSTCAVMRSVQIWCVVFCVSAVADLALKWPKVAG